jgi:hypothetical protein
VVLMVELPVRSTLAGILATDKAPFPRVEEMQRWEFFPSAYLRMDAHNLILKKEGRNLWT